MWIGALEFDLLLGNVHSLKEKRSLVRPMVAELKRMFGVHAAEVAHLDLHRRTGIGVAVVAADQQHVVELLDTIERRVAYHPEVDLLSVRRWIRTTQDE